MMWCHRGCSFSKEIFWNTVSLCNFIQHKPHSLICHSDTCDKYKLMLIVSSEFFTQEKSSGIFLVQFAGKEFSVWLFEKAWFSLKQKSLGKTSLLCSIELSDPPGLRTWEKQRACGSGLLGCIFLFLAIERKGWISWKINVSRRNGSFSSETPGYIPNI